jgi:hypothetical protein
VDPVDKLMVRSGWFLGLGDVIGSGPNEEGEVIAEEKQGLFDTECNSKYTEARFL